MNTYDARPAALRPLLDAFWSGKGWRQPPALPTGSELVRAVASGIVFTEARVLGHDGWVAAALAAATSLSSAEVEEAFVASLPSRRLDLRSALESFAFSRHLPVHEFDPGPSKLCALCGLPDTASEDLNVLNFERFKWGGVRRDDLRYVTFDLEQFQRAPRLQAGQEGVAVGRELLDALSRSAPDATATTTAPQLRMVKGNKAEREVLLDILGVCGVLETTEHPGYLTSFVPYAHRVLPPQRFVDPELPGLLVARKRRRQRRCRSGGTALAPLREPPPRFRVRAPEWPARSLIGCGRAARPPVPRPTGWIAAGVQA